MFSADLNDPIVRQWAIAQKLGYGYPAGMSPEQAKQNGLITGPQYVEIKNHLPDPVTAMDLVNYSVVSPTLDVVGQPIVAGLNAIKNVGMVSTALLASFALLWGFTFYKGLKKR